MNRVPFGPGPYGVSQSWFFDQHYYVGLADDMDFGIKYRRESGDWVFDVAYYLRDEGNGTGNNFSTDSVRYSYDVTNESGMGYEERNQVNLRAIYHYNTDSLESALGMSFQAGQLKSRGIQSDGEHYAISGHAVINWNNWKLAPQLTYYKYNISANQSLGTDQLVQMGAYDFASLIPAEAFIPAVSLSYYLKTESVSWLDSITPYVEASSIQKTEDVFNDSQMLIIGAAFASGGWYIYADLAYSNGNDFVGNEGGYGATSPSVTPGGFTSNRLGENPDDDWQTRFNLNFGYYF